MDPKARGALARTHIGTSGYVYPDWRGRFYPQELAAREWLSRYAAQFDTVELNNAFYRLPKEPAVRGWIERTPESFLFTVKGSRYLTHMNGCSIPAAGWTASSTASRRWWRQDASVRCSGSSRRSRRRTCRAC